MELPDTEAHIATLLDRCAATQAGITFYAPGELSNPTHLSYNELHASVTQKADLLRRYPGIRPGKIVLIHLQSHRDSIVWFWASIRARCIPALSTPLVNNGEGRMAHFKHLYSLLLDPIVITRQELVYGDFAENDILRLITVEDVESLRDAKSETANSPTTGLINSCTDISTNRSTIHPRCHTNRAECSLEGVAMLMLTSGTTGNAKAVCLTHK